MFTLNKNPFLFISTEHKSIKNTCNEATGVAQRLQEA